ncbi:MAG: FTR1 family iron permease [Elainella sp. C42_A2020_010]|nr:FTR1 family iron permease [Elainella sp. C42_A2020_010]
MDLSSALPTFVVTLREGTEAALVVGIVLAYLKKAGQTRLNPWVYGGIGVGILGSVLVGLLFGGVLAALDQSNQAYAPILKQLLEGGFGVVAIGLLSWMLIWMTQQARQMKSEVEGAITSVLQQGGSAGWGVFGLVTIAVLREGFETVVFIAAQFQQGWVPALGALAGLVGATGIGVLLFQLGVKINLRQFFQVMGVLLLLIVSGLVVSALRHFDKAASLWSQLNESANLCFSQASCILGPQVWDLSQVLPDRQFPGILLKAFFGYTQTLYAVQAVAYLVFLITIGTIYLQSVNGKQMPASTAKEMTSQSN